MGKRSLRAVRAGEGVSSPLAAHGYDLPVAHEALCEAVELAMQDYRANEVVRRDR